MTMTAVQQMRATTRKKGSGKEEKDTGFEEKGRKDTGFEKDSPEKDAGEGKDE